MKIFTDFVQGLTNLIFQVKAEKMLNEAGNQWNGNIYTQLENQFKMTNTT